MREVYKTNNKQFDNSKQSDIDEFNKFNRKILSQIWMNGFMLIKPGNHQYEQEWLNFRLLNHHNFRRYNWISEWSTFVASSGGRMHLLLSFPLL